MLLSLAFWLAIGAQEVSEKLLIKVKDGGRSQGDLEEVEGETRDIGRRVGEGNSVEVWVSLLCEYFFHCANTCFLVLLHTEFVLYMDSSI